MTERAYRVFTGCWLVLALYLPAPGVGWALIGLLLFEGLTDLRLTFLGWRLRRLLGGQRAPSSAPDSAAQACRPCRFAFDAERALRLVIVVLLVSALVFAPGVLWWLPWFVAFALIGAGFSGLCPMVLALSCVGFRAPPMHIGLSVRIAGLVFWGLILVGGVLCAVMVSDIEQHVIGARVASATGASVELSLPSLAETVAGERRRIMLLLGLLFVCLGAALKYLLGWILTGPMSRMVQIAESLSEGQQELRFDQDRQDEFGYLARFCNRALDRVAEQKRGLGDALSRAQRSEAALLAEKERIQVTLHSIADAVITSDRRGQIEYLNPAAQALTGWGLDNVRGKKVWELIPLPEQAGEPGEHPMQACLRTGQVVDSCPQRTVARRDGTTVPVAGCAAPIRDPSGEVIGGVMVLRDVTLAHQLQHAQKMEAVGRLAGGVAHDMNNVLAAILGLVSALKLEAAPTDDIVNDLDAIIDAADRGGALTRNLLGFARKGTYQKRRVRLNEVVRQIELLLRRTISKKIVIETALDPDLAPVEADADQIGHVLMNLCINAADAMDGGGRLCIRTDNVTGTAERSVGATGEWAAWAEEPGQVGAQVRLQVIDDGHGMDRATLERACEPFFTTKGPGQGTGLGLAMAYGVAEGHDGSLHISSEIGRGTTVSVTLPAFGGARQTTAAGKPGLAGTATSGAATLLLVDDEPQVLRMGQRLLTRLGYRVILAQDGQQALERYHQHVDDIDLVVLDMGMPVMDGRECFERLRQIDPEARVLVCSGYAQSTDIEQMLRDGALGLVQKPFLVETLVEGIAKALPNPISAAQTKN